MIYVCPLLRRDQVGIVELPSLRSKSEIEPSKIRTERECEQRLCEKKKREYVGRVVFQR